MGTVARLKLHRQLHGSAVSRRHPVFERQQRKGDSNSVDGKLRRQC
jgi:hypothetical protein